MKPYDYLLIFLLCASVFFVTIQYMLKCELEDNFGDDYTMVLSLNTLSLLVGSLSLIALYGKANKEIMFNGDVEDE